MWETVPGMDKPVKFHLHEDCLGGKLVKLWLGLSTVVQLSSPAPPQSLRLRAHSTPGWRLLSTFCGCGLSLSLRCYF